MSFSKIYACDNFSSMSIGRTVCMRVGFGCSALHAPAKRKLNNELQPGLQSGICQIAGFKESS